MSHDATPRDRGALVTGATGTIGSAVARALAGAGVRVALHCHYQRERAVELAGELQVLGQDPPLVQDDVARDAAALFRQAEAAMGGVDILVNCAGAYHRCPLAGGPNFRRRG